MKRWYHSQGGGYRELSLILLGWVLQLTVWRGPPHSVYAGVELHWWRHSGEEQA